MGPDSLTDDNSPLPVLKNITTATVRKADDQTTSNDVRKDSIVPFELKIHQDSLAMEGSVVESRVPAPISVASVSPTEPSEEPVTVKSDDGVLVTASAIDQEADRLTTEVSNDPLSPNYRLNSQLNGSDDELETDAAERTIEVSVSSSISSVSQSSNNPRLADKEQDLPVKANAPPPSPIPAPPQTSGHFLPMDNKMAKPSTDGQGVAAPTSTAVEEDPLDYDDYSNMELPPSLPNLESVQLNRQLSIYPMNIVLNQSTSSNRAPV